MVLQACYCILIAFSLTACPVSATQNEASYLLVRFYNFFSFVSPVITTDDHGLIILDPRSVFLFFRISFPSDREMCLSSFSFLHFDLQRKPVSAPGKEQAGTKRLVSVLRKEGYNGKEGSYGEAEGHDKGMEIH